MNDPTVRRHQYRGQRGLWQVKYLRLFMTVWLSIFPDHIWLGQVGGTLPSLPEGLWRSLIAPNPQKTRKSSVRRQQTGTSVGQDGVQSRLRVLGKKRHACIQWQTRPECSGRKRKDPIGYESMILIVATPCRSTIYNGYNAVIYTQKNGKIESNSETYLRVATLSHGNLHHHPAESL